MVQIIYDGRPLPLYIETINGRDVIFIAEEVEEDGGVVTATYVAANGQSTYSYRTWRGVGTQAAGAQKLASRRQGVAAFLAMTPEERADRASKATARSFSGSLVGRQ